MASDFTSRFPLWSSFCINTFHFLVSNPPNALDIIDVATKLSVELGDDMNWKRFGMLLLDTTDDQDLTLIQQRKTGKPLVDKCQALLELWRGRNAAPKWEDVINVLKNPKIGLNLLATRLQTALGQGQQGKIAFYINC